MNSARHVLLISLLVASGCSGRSQRADGAAWFDAATDVVDAVDTADAVPEAQSEVAPANEAGVEVLPPDASPDTEADVGPFTMRATLIGMTDHAGTEVEFPGVGLSARTDADGQFVVPGLSDGSYAARFRNGAFEEEIPELIVRRGAPLVRFRNGTERSFPVVELPRGHRLHGAITPPPVTMSPANGWLMIAGGTALTLLNSEGRQPRVLASDVDRAYGFIDEDRVFFGRPGTGITDGSRLMSVPVAGGAESVWLSPAQSTISPIFVLGRTKVLYGHAGPRSAGLGAWYLAGVDGKNAGQVGSMSGPYAMSADGFWFATASSISGAPGALELADLRTGQTRVIEATLTAVIREMTFTPDSRWLVYGDGRRIMSAATAGGAPTALGRADSLVLSPDGRFVLVQDRYDSPLQIVAVDSGTARTVPSAPTAASHSMNGFSRDTRYVFPATYPKAVFPVDTLTPIVLNDSARDVKLVGYVTATRTVYFTCVPWESTTSVLFTLALESSEKPKMVMERPDNIGLNSSGRFFYFTDPWAPAPRTGALTVVDLDNGRTLVFRPAVAPLHFAQDDSRVFYFDGESKVQVGDLRDGKVTTLGTAMPNPDLRGFSPDGSRVVFGSGGVYTMATSDGSTATVFARQIAGIQWNKNRLLYSIYDYGDRPAFVYGLYLAHEP